MKLGILCTMINGFGRRGFYNSQEIGLGRTLVRKGCRVVVYKCLKRTKNAKRECIQAEPGLAVWYLPVPGLGAHGYLFPGVLEKDLDGLLCFGDNQVFLPHIYDFCRKNEILFVPYIGTAHSLHGGLRGRVMDAWFRAGTLKIFRENPVIGKTEKAREELKALGVSRITVAPVGLDGAVLKHDFAACDPGQLRREFGFEPDDVVVLSVARLEQEKRPLDLIGMFMRIRHRKKFRLILVGEGPLGQEVAERIREWGIGKEARIISRVPYEEMWKLYVMSDYFVNLNRGEIFGMAVMEAVYYKTSVAAVMAPGPALTLQGMEGHCLCRDDGQVEEWLTKEYPPEHSLAESSEKMIRDFSWEKCADAFLALAEQKRGEA